MAWSDLTESAFLTVDANYEFFTDGTDAIVGELNPGELVILTFNVDAAGTSDDLDILPVQGQLISTGNTLDGVTSTTDVELDTAADGFSNDDDMNGLWIVFTSGACQGEGRLIVDSVAADDGVNLSHALSTSPSAGDSYDLYRFVPVVPFVMDPQTTITTDAQNNDGTTLSYGAGRYWACLTRATGSTDAHRVKMGYETSGVSI